MREKEAASAGEAPAEGASGPGSSCTGEAGAQEAMVLLKMEQSQRQELIRFIEAERNKAQGMNNVEAAYQPENEVRVADGAV